MDEILNGHNKNEYPPMHTAEHIVNRTMVNMFGCGRSKNAHIERKKSKISSADMPVTYDYEDAANVEDGISLEKLPEGASSTIRIVRVGDYDKCACIGKHVEHTAQIGRVVLLGTNWDEEKKSFRLRFKLEGTDWEQ